MKHTREIGVNTEKKSAENMVDEFIDKPRKLLMLSRFNIKKKQRKNILKVYLITKNFLTHGFFIKTALQVARSRIFNNAFTRTDIAYNKTEYFYKFQIVDKFFVKYATTAFSFWRNSEWRKNTWFEALVYPRSKSFFLNRKFPGSLYSHKYKPHWMFHTAPRIYRRIKKPLDYKHNKLYFLFKKMFFSFYRPAIKLNKMRRIKHILKSFFLPFYGHRTLKQVKNIMKTQRFKKTLIQSTIGYLVRMFEQRLDVMLYKCNLAPTILVSRQLISSRCIFINGIEQFNPARIVQPYEFTEISSRLNRFAQNISARKKSLERFSWRIRAQYDLKLAKKPIVKSILQTPNNKIQVQINALNHCGSWWWRKPKSKNINELLDIVVIKSNNKSSNKSSNVEIKTNPLLSRFGSLWWRNPKSSDLRKMDRISNTTFNWIKLSASGK
jgi:ribosomal protein S4